MWPESTAVKSLGILGKAIKNVSSEAVATAKDISSKIEPAPDAKGLKDTVDIVFD